MQQKFIVANWKMQLPFVQALQLAQTMSHKISTLSHNFPQTKIILCPSFEALYPVKKVLDNAAIFLGAQACCPYPRGAYTGQVSAESLAELGCTYCIIGHSERRTLCKETNQDIALQLEQLLLANITPIICIGENKEQSSSESIKELELQLNPLTTLLQSWQPSPAQILIAYEPTWAIGSGKTPAINHLNTIYNWLYDYCKPIAQTTNLHFLYGGSVNQETVSLLLPTNHLQGFLIGNASLDFQKFENIVSLIS